MKQDSEIKVGTKVTLKDTSQQVTSLSLLKIYEVKKYNNARYCHPAVQLENGKWYRTCHFDVVNSTSTEVATVPLIDHAPKVVVCVGYKNYSEFDSIEDANRFISKSLKEKPTREFAVYKLSSTAKVRDFPIVWETA